MLPTTRNRPLARGEVGAFLRKMADDDDDDCDGLAFYGEEIGTLARGAPALSRCVTAAQREVGRGTR